MSMAAKKLAVVPFAPPRPSGDGALRLGRVLGRDRDRFRIEWRGREEIARCDPAVDPALLDEAMASGARIVVEDGPEPVIVGALAIARTIAVDREGAIRVSVKQFEVTAEEALLKTTSAFVSLKGDEVELFGRRIVSRARELARILARAIQLN
jgi:hypothetical protein